MEGLRVTQQVEPKVRWCLTEVGHQNEGPQIQTPGVSTGGLA